MFIVDKVCIPKALLNINFECDYNACKGACCVVGEMGAPLMREEQVVIEGRLQEIIPKLDSEAQKVIESSGFWEEFDGILSVRCISEGERCVFSQLNSQDCVQCILEQFPDKDLNRTLRPVSCCLFPIRVREMNGLFFLDFEEWDECKAARSTKTQVLDFCASNLADRFGSAWLERLIRLRKNIDMG